MDPPPPHMTIGPWTGTVPRYSHPSVQHSGPLSATRNEYPSVASHASSHVGPHGSARVHAQSPHGGAIHDHRRGQPTQDERSSSSFSSRRISGWSRQVDEHSPSPAIVDVRRKRSRSALTGPDAYPTTGHSSDPSTVGKRPRITRDESRPGPPAYASDHPRSSLGGGGGGGIAASGEAGDDDDMRDSEDDDSTGRMDMKGLSRDEIRKVKNRDKQRRLRERRANQLEVLKSQSTGLQAQVSNLQRRLQEQADRAARREENLQAQIIRLQAAQASSAAARVSAALYPAPDEIGDEAQARLSVTRAEYRPFSLARHSSDSAASAGATALPHFRSDTSRGYAPAPDARRPMGSLASISQVFDGVVNVTPGTRLSWASGSSQESGYFGSMYPASETLVDSRRQSEDPRHLPFPHSIESFNFGELQSKVESAFWTPAGRPDPVHVDPPVSEESAQRIRAARAPYRMETLDLLQQEDVLAIPRFQAVTTARFLISAKLRESAFMPNESYSTSYAVEYAKSMRDKKVRDRGGPAVSPCTAHRGHEGSTPPWRGLFTSAQVYLLMRVLCDFTNEAGSRERFDDAQVRSTKDLRKVQAHQDWRARPARDMRIGFVPALQLRYRLIERNELRDEEGLGVNELLEDMLFEGRCAWPNSMRRNKPGKLTTEKLRFNRLYGNACEMYAWELPDSFWDRWQHVYPYGKIMCQSLRTWRRKDGHKGSEAFCVISGAEPLMARTDLTIGLPPAGWKGDDGQSGWRAIAMGT